MSADIDCGGGPVLQQLSARIAPRPLARGPAGSGVAGRGEVAHGAAASWGGDVAAAEGNVSLLEKSKTARRARNLNIASREVHCQALLEIVSDTTMKKRFPFGRRRVSLGKINQLFPNLHLS